MLEMVGAQCCGCGACLNICTKYAISMRENSEGFLYPYIDENKCVQCNSCERACPSIHPPAIHKAKASYAAFCKDEKKHMQSSSGGVFALLAERAINSNGIVFGAAFDNGFQVRHILVDSLDELQRIKGSKYIQSDIGTTYRSIREQLKNGKLVLFAGTPCQNAGLKSFLGRDYDQLICVDLFCHGVPSYRTTEKIISDMFPNSIPSEIVFRDKTNGIDDTTVNFCFEDRVVKSKYADNVLMKGFTQDMFLRQSCYKCQFKGTDRCSDITIGDFWGIKRFYPSFYNNKGVSAVIIQSKKGAEWFDSIMNQINFIEVDINNILPANQSICSSAFSNPKRDAFYRRYRSENTVDLINELYDPNYWDYLFDEKSQSIGKRVLNKLTAIVCRGRK